MPAQIVIGHLTGWASTRRPPTFLSCSFGTRVHTGMGSTISVVLLGVAVIASAAILARTYAQAIQPREDADGKPGKNAKRNKRRRENLKAKLHPDFASSEKQQQQQSVMERNQSTQSSAGPDPSQPVSVVGEDFQPLQQQSSRTSPSQPSSQRNNQRPLAERRAPRGRQGKVADMIDPEVDTRPTMARVVQINKDGRAVPQKEPQKQPASSTSSAAPTSALGESWVDVRAQESSANDASLSESEDLEEEEEEAWEQVPNKASGSSPSHFISSLEPTSSSGSRLTLMPFNLQKQSL